MISNKRTGPGSLFMEVLTEANVNNRFQLKILPNEGPFSIFVFQIYTIGEEDVPNLVTPKSEILSVGPYIAYK